MYSEAGSIYFEIQVGTLPNRVTRISNRRIFLAREQPMCDAGPRSLSVLRTGRAWLWMIPELSSRPGWPSRLTTVATLYDRLDGYVFRVSPFMFMKTSSTQRRWP